MEHTYRSIDEHAHHTQVQETSIEEMELQSWKKKLIWSWIFTIPIALVMLAERFLGFEPFSDTVMHVLILIVAFPVVFVAGWQTIKGGIRGLYTFYFNMDSLIALGTVIAYLSGIIHIFFKSGDFSGIAAMIMAIFITGKFIETKARGQATQEIRKLLELGAKKARIMRGKKEVEVNISELKMGDIMIVKPGEKVPTDGIVIKGESAVDESMISGESLPVDKTKGSSVIGATLNQDGVLYVKATKVGNDTFLAHIITLVEEAQGTKIPIQRLADKITNVFVPIILGLALITFGAWWYSTGDFKTALGTGIAVLVIACPCALGLAVPIALMVGSGIASKNGILIRKGEAIQTMKQVKILVFDKTGTLTKGKPEVTDIYSKVKESYLLDIAASLERLSEHPIAHAIISKANLKKYRKVTGFSIVRGKGVTGKIGTKEIVIGNRALLAEKKISYKECDSKIEQFEVQGKTAMIVAESKKVIGIIAVADELKEESAQAIVDLTQQGYRTVMITGDNERTARAIALRVGISEVLANVLPEEKAKRVEELQKEGFLAFIGDGINDAPALKQANVGIAMGTGTDIAIEAGDIVLVKGSLMGVVQAITISKATFSKIKQNLFWAFAYNVVMIPIAVAGLLHPLFAEIAMALSSITIVTNANLLRRRNI